MSANRHLNLPAAPHARWGNTSAANARLASNSRRAYYTFFGKIDANDSVWANLKIWNDSDQNGISDTEHELFNLSDFDITAINLASTITNTPDGQGNTKTRTGRFTVADGSTGIWLAA